MVTAESSESVAQAVETLWPAFDDVEEVLQDTAVARVKRSVRVVHAMLVTVAGLLPEVFAGCEMTLSALRERFGTRSMLVMLREMAAPHLHAIPPPLGFGHRAQPREINVCVRQHRSDPDRPP